MGMGSARLGRIFYAPFGVAAMSRAAELRLSDRAPADGGANALSVETDAMVLKQLARRYESKKGNVSSGDWSAREEIKSVHCSWWARAILRVASERKKKQWRRHHATIGDVPFPVPNAEIPRLTTSSEAPVARIAVKVQYQLEVQAFEASSDRGTGPMMAAIGVLSLTEST